MEPAEPLFSANSDTEREFLPAGEGLTLDSIVLRHHGPNVIW